MESLIILVALLVALLAGYAASLYVPISDPSVTQRLDEIDELAVVREPIEWVGLPFIRLIPQYIKGIEADLYWAAFTAPSWARRTPAWIVGRQVLMTAGLGVVTAWALRSNLGLWIGGYLGWVLMRMDLSGKASQVRRQISQELPEFLQLIAAESTSGAGLEAVLIRAAQGEGTLPTWLRRVLDIAHGRSLLLSRGTRPCILMHEAELSKHPDLISFALQMSFALHGAQVKETLTRLATQFSDTYIGKAEVRTERLANVLGVLVAVFYFLPFLAIILIIVGAPLIRAL